MKKIQLFEADVSKAEARKLMVHLTSLRKSQVFYPINSAGVIRLGFDLDFELSDIDYHLDITTKGSIL